MMPFGGADAGPAVSRIRREPQPHRQAGDAALELLELRDVNRDRGVAEIGDQFRGPRRGRGHQQPAVAEIDDVRTGFLRHRPEMRPERRVVDQRRVAR